MRIFIVVLAAIASASCAIDQAMSAIGGGQSYVELLTCLEMSGGQFSTRPR
jgi:hypothetical protein